ncbi:hypothetical protein NBRC10513v2_007660 [Rhodotorula toruloides]|uniref:Uncharacterized protein n=1 Tax=Rhodotorula toruloides TaxID=5286 RepID=A0A2S9ZX96_RHOTO|nr:hypothetical protein AAT19DRAFT_11121 [Rhodotorula toruloides]
MSRLSLAHTLPPELLSRIFGWLIEIKSRLADHMERFAFGSLEWPLTSNIPELHAASLVCKRWRTPAQQALCRSFDLADVDAIDLSSTFYFRPELAHAVRAIAFEFPVDQANSFRDFDAACENAFDVLRVCVHIQHLVIGFVTSNMREALIDVLDALPLKTLILREYGGWSGLHLERLTRLTPLEFCGLAQKPTLRYYHLRLGPRLAQYQSPFPPIPSLRSSVTTLCLIVHASTFLTRLLTMCSGTLAHLDLLFEDVRPDEGFMTSLGLLTHLEELRIRRIGSREDESAPLAPTLSCLVHLKKLIVSDTLACSGIILNAPRSLKHIVIQIFEDVLAALDDLRAHLEDGTSRTACEILEFVLPDLDTDDEGDGTDDEEAAAISTAVAVCARRGILFKHQRNDYSTNKFRTTRFSFL